MVFQACTLLFAIILLTGALGAQESDNDPPPWLLFEKGKYEFEKGELGQALMLFQQAREKAGGNYPQAEVAIGDIFFDGQEYSLAEKFYKKAYEHRQAFLTQQEKYSVLLKLAHLYENMSAYKQMEDQLLEIISDDPYFSDQAYSRYRRALSDLFKKNGLDQMLRYYRIDILFPQEAHSRLSYFYYRTGNNSKSILHALYAINSVLTRAIEEIRKIDPEYQFTSIGNLLLLTSERDNILRLFYGSDLFRTMYYLAGSSFDAGFKTRARQVWLLIADTPLALEYAVLSAKQLNSPWVEPYIDVLTPRKIERR
jgi:tetratricopeptide (TPR) repeat protein